VLGAGMEFLSEIYRVPGAIWSSYNGLYDVKTTVGVLNKRYLPIRSMLVYHEVLQYSRAGELPGPLLSPSSITV
jgi:hypothetical protein